MSELLRVDIPCHGKPFQIGALYDCATETLHEDHYLWDMNKLEEDAIKKEELHIMNQTWSVEDETKKKDTHIGLKAGMKFSLLSNLFEAGASAEYNYDCTRREKEVRATLELSVSTGYTKINKFKNIFDREMYDRALEHNFFGATHLVARVTYGCDAHFEFTRSIQERETKHEVATEVKAVLNCIFKGGGCAEIGACIKRSIEEITDSYCFTYRGDFILDSNPTTFDEVVRVYKSLRCTSTEKSPKPLVAHIVPIFDFMKVHDIPCPPKPVRPIKASLLHEVYDLLEKFRERRKELYHLSEHETCKQLVALKEEIVECAHNHAESEEEIKADIERLIPEIRRLEKEETILKNLIEKGNQTYKKAKADVKFARKKISQLSHYLGQIKDDPNIKMVTNDELETEIVSVASGRAVCFAFNSATTLPINEQDHAIQRMFFQFLFHNYVSFAHANAKSKTQFIVTETNFEQGIPQGPETILYEEGISSKFELPGAPVKPFGYTPLQDPQGAIRLTWTKPLLGAENILYYVVRYHNKKWKRWESTRTNTADTEIVITLDPELHPNREYSIIIQAVSKAGLSAPSKDTIKIPKWVYIRTH